MDKDQMFQPSVIGPPPPAPLPNIPAPPPVPVKKSNKTLLWVVIGSVSVLIIILIVVVVVGGSKKPAKKSANSNASSTSSSTYDKATALDVQQGSDAISNHLNQVNDSQSLPPSALDDKTLGL